MTTEATASIVFLSFLLFTIASMIRPYGWFAPVGMFLSGLLSMWVLWVIK